MSEVRALLLTDVVDSTQLSERLGEAELAALWAGIGLSVGRANFRRFS